LAYGKKDGGISIILTENGEILFELNGKLNLGMVTGMTWGFFLKSLSSKNILDPFGKNSLANKLILPVSPNIYSEKYPFSVILLHKRSFYRSNIAKLRYFSEMKNEFTMVLISDNTGNVIAKYALFKK